jgi:hypothetical protein
MRIDVDESPVLESGSTPDVIGGVVILDHVDLFRRETETVRRVD